MSFARNITTELTSKNIGVEGEEFYALVEGYASKVAALNGLEIERDFDLLGKAQAVAINDNEKVKAECELAFLNYLETVDKGVKEVMLSQNDNADKLQKLHDYALNLACGQERNFGVASYRKSSHIADLLQKEENVYKAGREAYQKMSEVKYNEDTLLRLVNLYKARGAEGDDEALKEMALSQVNRAEEEFFTSQMRYVNAVVDALVEDEVRMEKARAEEAVSFA